MNKLHSVQDDQAKQLKELKDELSKVKASADGNAASIQAEKKAREDDAYFTKLDVKTLESKFKLVQGYFESEVGVAQSSKGQDPSKGVYLGKRNAKEKEARQLIDQLVIQFPSGAHGAALKRS